MSKSATPFLNDLGIHDYTAFHASSFLYDARVAVRPIGAIHREWSHTTSRTWICSREPSCCCTDGFIDPLLEQPRGHEASKVCHAPPGQSQ